MIIRNPDNGATINTAAGGKNWFFPKSTTQNFPDEVGVSLLEKYGFLEKLDISKSATVEEADGRFKCSNCDYQNEQKIGVLGHLRSHPKSEIKVIEAKPVGDTIKRPTLYEERAKAQGLNPDSDLERQFPGVEFYGEGYEEQHSAITIRDFTGRIEDVN